MPRAAVKAGCEVTGIDAAEPLIAAAGRRIEMEKLPIRYLTADATKLLDDAGVLAIDMKPASADAITIVLAIQNMTPLSPIWQACRTVLKPGGGADSGDDASVLSDSAAIGLVVAARDASFAGRRNPRHSTIFVQQQNRHSNPPRPRSLLAMARMRTPRRIFIGRCRRISVHTLGRRAGLLIDHIEEWPSHKSSQEGPKKAALDRARKEIPMFLAVRAVRG